MTGLIANNLKTIRNNIESACAHSNRNPEDVKLVAVTKYAKIEWVRELVNEGESHLGESRPQQLAERASEFPNSIHWHMIGQLQRNKIRKILPLVELIHSVHSFKLLEAIDRIAEEESLTPSVLLQVNVSGEESKQGWSPEELRSEWERIKDLNHVTVKGLMTMAPLCADPEDARPYFRELKEFRDELNENSSGNSPLTELSMGMSRDYSIAIEEGSTLIRIGSQLFEGLS